MYLENLICEQCGKEYPKNFKFNSCNKCNGLLDCVYDYKKIKKILNIDKIKARENNIWRWKEFLPIDNENNIISLGEGCTPLQKSKIIAKKFGLKNLFIKNECINPTSTFKDRSFSTAISKAVEDNIRFAYTESTGNAGASFAAYASVAQIKNLVLVGEQITDEKLAMLLVYGSRVIKLKYNSAEEIQNLIDWCSKKLNLYSFYLYKNCFRVEGYKTIAFETYLDLNLEVPDVMIHPTANGGGLYGTWLGFQELKKVGLIDKIPKMIAVQPSACAPLYKAFKENKIEADKFGDEKATFAQSISCDYPVLKGKKPLEAVYNSGGTILKLTDDEILEGIKILGQEGIFAEPAGGIVASAIEKLVNEKYIKNEDIIVGVITGSGLKQPDTVFKIYKKPVRSYRCNSKYIKNALTELISV